MQGLPLSSPGGALSGYQDSIDDRQPGRPPLAEPPPRDSRFGSPLKLSRVHWVRPKVVVEGYLTSLGPRTTYFVRSTNQGQREDKPAKQVVRPVPHPSRRSRT